MNLKFNKKYTDKMMSYYRPQLDVDCIIHNTLTDFFGIFHGNIISDIYQQNHTDKDNNIPEGSGSSQPFNNRYLEIQQSDISSSYFTNSSISFYNMNSDDIAGISIKLSNVCTINDGSDEVVLFASKDKFITVTRSRADWNSLNFKITNLKLNISKIASCYVSNKPAKSISDTDSYYFDFTTCKVFHDKSEATYEESNLTIKMPDVCKDNCYVGTFQNVPGFKFHLYELIFFRESLTDTEIADINNIKNTIFEFDPLCVISSPEKDSYITFNDKSIIESSTNVFTESLKNSGSYNESLICQLPKLPLVFDSICNNNVTSIFKDDSFYGDEGLFNLPHTQTVDFLTDIIGCKFNNCNGCECKDFEQIALTDKDIFRVYNINDRTVKITKSTQSNKMEIKQEETNSKYGSKVLSIDNNGENYPLLHIKFIGTTLKFYVKIPKNSPDCDIKGNFDKTPTLYANVSETKEIESTNDYIIKEFTIVVPGESNKLHLASLYFYARKCEVLYIKCNGHIINPKVDFTYKYIITYESEGLTKIIASETEIKDNSTLNWSDKTKLYNEKEYDMHTPETKNLFFGSKHRLKGPTDEYTSDFIFKYGFDYYGPFMNAQTKRLKSKNYSLYVLIGQERYSFRTHSNIKLICSKTKPQTYYDRLPNKFNILKITQDSLNLV